MSGPHISIQKLHYESTRLTSDKRELNEYINEIRESQVTTTSISFQRQPSGKILRHIKK